MTNTGAGANKIFVASAPISAPKKYLKRPSSTSGSGENAWIHSSWLRLRLLSFGVNCFYTSHVKTKIFAIVCLLPLVASTTIHVYFIDCEFTQFDRHVLSLDSFATF